MALQMLAARCLFIASAFPRCFKKPAEIRLPLSLIPAKGRSTQRLVVPCHLVTEPIPYELANHTHILLVQVEHFGGGGTCQAHRLRRVVDCQTIRLALRYRGVELDGGVVVARRCEGATNRYICIGERALRIAGGGAHVANLARSSTEDGV